MILAQITLYRNDHLRGVIVCVVVLDSHPKEGCFWLRPFRGTLEVLVRKGVYGLRKGKSQQHVGRFSATVAFDEYVQRTIHKEHYTCAKDGVYRPTEDAPLAVDIARAMRIERSRSSKRYRITPPNTIVTNKRRLLEFSNS